jgi:cytochrome b561
MTTYDSAFKYSRPLVFLHWLMFLLLVVVYAAIEFRVLYDKGMPEREYCLRSLRLMRFWPNKSNCCMPWQAISAMA